MAAWASIGRSAFRAASLNLEDGADRALGDRAAGPYANTARLHSEAEIDKPAHALLMGMDAAMDASAPRPGWG